MTERELSALPAELASQLRYLDRKVRGLAALRGVGVVCVVLCAGVATGVLVDWLFDLGVGTRVTLLLGVCAAALVAVMAAIIRPLIRRVTSTELAALVDTSFPDLRERIESTVELSDPDLPESQKGSELMRSLLMKETVRRSEQVDFGAAADGSSAFRWMLVGVLALLLIVLPFGLSKDGYALMLSRFLTPWRNLERATNLYFEVEQGDRTVARGEDVTIQAVPKWRVAAGERPEAAWLQWRNVNGETDERRMQWSATDEAYIATLPHVFTSFDYEISAGRARTRTYYIDVVERPDITELSLEIVPPAYTGRAARTLDGAIGRIEVFERSELTFDVAFNKPVESAELVWLDGDASPGAVENTGRQPLTLDATGTAGQLKLSAQQSGAYAILLCDEHDLQSLPGVSRELVVIGDAPPQVSWADVDPARIINIPAIEVRPGEEVPLPVRASDDIGVADLALHVEVIQRSEHLGPLAAESVQLGQPLVRHEYLLKLSDFDLQEGDLLSVRARAVDARPVPEPQEAWSPSRLIRINKDADPAGLQALMQQQQQLRNAIEEIRQDVQQDRNEARKLEDEAARKLKEQAPFERQPDVAGLAQNEREVQQRIEQLAAAFLTHPLQNSIAEQTQQVARGPVERAREHLQQAEAAPAADTRQQRDRLRKAIGDLSRADQQLEELLKKFDELAALERDLQQVQQLAEQAQQLTREVEQFEQDQAELERLQKEQQVGEQQQRQQQQQLDERQMDLQDEQQDLASALDHLLEERPEILEAARQQQIDQLQQLADRANDLARHQDRLAAAMNREPEDPVAQSPEAKSNAGPQASEGADSPAPDGPSQTGEKAADPESSEPSSSAENRKQAGEPSGKPSPVASPPSRPQQPEADPHADRPQPQAAESPAQQQRQLAEQAARQAVETAREQGRASDAAQQARQFAERALQAAEQAERGLLDDASRTAQQATQSAQKTTGQMQQSTEPFPQRMREQSAALARQQSELAEQLGEAAQSPQHRQDAQRQGQQQIAEQTRQLAQQLAQAAERMNSQPVDRPQAGERAAQATEMAQQAQQSQQQAQSQMQQQRPREAAEPARQAAQSLRQASDQAQQASREGDRPQESPVPGEVGQQVADARRQLDQAAQQLGERSQQQSNQNPSNREEPAGQQGQQNQTQPGEGTEGPQGQQGEQGESPEGGQQPGEGQQQQGESPDTQKPGENGQPGNREGQSPSNQPGQNAQPSSAEAMRRVTESLQQAARQMGLQRSQRSQNKGQNQQSGDSQDGENGPQGGYGARGGLSLAELEAELGRISQRNWGQLPDRVESELQLSQQKKPDADYARLIRMYFEDVARKQSAVDSLKDGGEELE